MRWLLVLITTACTVIPFHPGTAQAQGGTESITGQITAGDSGQPLAGVSVSVVGTRLGALTASNGRFVITGVAAGTYQIKATFLGYGEQVTEGVVVAAGSPAVVNFTLQPEAIHLQELVVVGYGTQKRGEITGSVASVSSKDFNQVPARDAASLIAGKMPGLSVTTPSGNPTANSEISLRGMSTIVGSASPLILVDGVPGNLRTVAPEDIEAITVLKDGSAAAVYGSRASNGVILITTKRHEEGRAPTIRYDGYVGYETIYNAPEFLTAADYRRLIGEGYGFQDHGFDTNWQDQVLRSPMSQRHNMTVSGGSNNTSYTASLNYNDTQGIFQRSDNHELTGRINVGHRMYDGKLQVDLNLLNRVQSYLTGPSYNSAWRQALIRNPTDRVMDDDGMWQERGTYMYTNPAGLINEVNGDYEGRNLRMHGTVTYRPIDQLRLSIMGGTTRGSSMSGTATTFRHVSTTQEGRNSNAGRSASQNVDRILEMTGTFAQRFSGHNVTFLGGYAYQDFVNDNFSASTWDFPTDLFGYNQLERGDALGQGKASMSSGKSDYKLIGFFSRLNYDWNNRFLLMGSIRYEGNSRFGADHKWGLFPAVSAGWRLTEEGFMKNLSFVDDLKLRAGFGVTGIAPTSSYLSLTSYGYGGRFLYNGRWVQGLSPSRNPNPDLRWERKEEINVGMDFTLFNRRLNGSLEVYQRDNRDMLYNYSVPVPPYLYNRILANVGHMQNKGIEAELSYNVINGRDFRWTTSAAGSTNKNKLVSLSNKLFESASFFYEGHTGEPIQQSTHRIDIGGPIGNFYGYKSVDIDTAGVWMVLNKDGEQISIKDATEQDRHILGNGVPKYYLSWNNSAQYKNFDLNLNMRGAFKFQILNFQELYYANPTIIQYNMLKSAFDPVYGKRTVNYDLAYVSYYIEDGDYWKLDNVTLGYTLGKEALRLIPGVVSNARVYLSGRNLLTLTGYKGLDPEVNTNGLAPGNDSRDKYPTTRAFTAGVNLTF